MADPKPSASSKRSDLDDEDTVTILNGVIDFMASHGGSVPTPTTAEPFFDSIKDSLHKELTSKQVYKRIGTLKRKYQRAVDLSVQKTPFDRTFFDLAQKVWGDKEKKNAEGEENDKPKRERNKRKHKIEEKNEDAKKIEKIKKQKLEKSEEEPKTEKVKKKKKKENKKKTEKNEIEIDDGDDVEINDGVDEFKYLHVQGRVYFENEGFPLECVESGLKSMDKSKARVLEKRWRTYFEEDMKIKEKLFELEKDLRSLLNAALKKGARS